MEFSGSTRAMRALDRAAPVIRESEGYLIDLYLYFFAVFGRPARDQ